MFTCASFVVFLAGIRDLIRRAKPDQEFLASLIFSAGFVYVILLLVADSVQVGRALASGGTVDPTLVGSGGEASLLIWGPLALLQPQRPRDSDRGGIARPLDSCRKRGSDTAYPRQLTSSDRKG